MEQVRENGKSCLQTRFETGLYIGLLLFAELALQLSVYRNFIGIGAYYTLLSLLKRLMLLLAVAAAAGFAVLLLKDRVQGRRKLWELRGMLSYEQLFLLFAAIWFFLTCILRGRTVGGDYLEANNLELFTALSVAFLLFPFASYCGRGRARASMEGLMISLVLPFAVLTVWLLWHYFRAEYVTLPSGAQLEMGAESMLQLQGQNHNILAQTGLAMLGFSVVLLRLRKPAEKPLYFLCALIFGVFLVLTNSRNAWFGALLFLAGSAFLCGLDRLDGKKKPVQVGVGVVFALVAGLLWLWMKDAVFDLLRRSLAHFAPVQTAVGAGGTAAAGAVQARGYADVATAGNRMPLYRACIAAMFSSPYRFFFGVTPSDVVGTLRETGVAGVSGTYNYGQAHNFFLQMGMSFGVPVMLGTVVFSISLVLRALRVMFGRGKAPFRGAGTFALLVCCLLACDMLEAALAFRARFICLAFYLLAGWLVAMEKDGKT